MKSLFAIAVVLFFAVSGSFALKCYTCQKEGSTSCQTGTQTCATGFDTCVKVVVKGDTGKAVDARCGIKSRCENLKDEACAAAKVVAPQINSCNVYCCSGDNCNASPESASATSAVLVTSVFAAILMK